MTIVIVNIYTCVFQNFTFSDKMLPSPTIYLRSLHHYSKRLAAAGVLTSAKCRHCVGAVRSFPAMNRMFVTTSLQLQSLPNLDIEKIKAQKNITDKAKLLYDMKAVEDPDKFVKEYLEKLSGEDLDLLKLIQLEYWVLESEGHSLPEPDTMTDQRWFVLYVNCPTRARRIKQYRYWRKLDFSQANSQAKRATRGLREEKRRQEVARLQDAGELPYASRLVLRIYETTMNIAYYNNMFHAMQFGCSLVYDFSFEETMSFQETKNTVEQMLMAHNANKIALEPFHVVWANLARDSNTRKILTRAMVNYEDKPMTFTEKHYLDLYPKEDLVWLTPNAPEVLRKYDPTKVYIIGAIVDKAGQPPVTYAKAKKEGIKAYRLPVDEYIQ